MPAILHPFCLVTILPYHAFPHTAFSHLYHHHLILCLCLTSCKWLLIIECTVVLLIDSFNVLKNVVLPKLDLAGKSTFQFSFSLIVMDSIYSNAYCLHLNNIEGAYVPCILLVSGVCNTFWTSILHFIWQMMESLIMTLSDSATNLHFKYSNNSELLLNGLLWSSHALG